MSEHQRFNVNFFKPKSDAEKANTRLISILVIVWAVAVFGFQILLIGAGKPVAEQTLIDFRALWPEVQQAAPAKSDLQAFSRQLLTTLGKNDTIKEEDQKIMGQALAVTLNLLDPAINSASGAAAAIGLGNDGFDPLLRDQLEKHYIQSGAADYNGLTALPETMEAYLIHNRSALTDSTFLGFPFHYFYTAQFLLILFIILCLVYARAVDKKNTRLGIEE